MQDWEITKQREVSKQGSPPPFSAPQQGSEHPSKLGASDMRAASIASGKLFASSCCATTADLKKEERTGAQATAAHAGRCSSGLRGMLAGATSRVAAVP